MDYTAEARRRKRHFKPGPTGLAAHFDRNLAIRHGLLEVIERDAHQSWNLGPDRVRGRSRVEPRSADHPAIGGVLDRIAAAGLSVFTWDMTPPAGIACYLAEIVDFEEDTTTAYAQGSAADPDPRIALLKALLEAVQVRLTYIAGSRDDLEWSDYGARFDAVVASRWHLRCEPPGKPMVLGNRPETNLAALCGRLGLHPVVAVDVTDPGGPVHVVKVVVPNACDVRAVERPSSGYSSVLQFAEG
jgi:ribosomal protein S12 methylthiotransferase accessory factor